MSQNNIVLNNGQQMIVTTDLSKIFVWNNRYDVANYTNGTGSIITIPQGTLLGKVAATQKVVLYDSAAVDGSQYPVGVLIEDYTVAIGATVQLTYCVEGDVVKDKVLLPTVGDTMATVVELRSIQDRIGSDTVGIKLVTSTSNSEYDNL